MQDLPILIAIAGFSVMGIGAIVKPAFVTAQFGILELTPGVARFGPFNAHFIRDVGLVCFASGLSAWRE